MTIDLFCNGSIFYGTYMIILVLQCTGHKLQWTYMAKEVYGIRLIWQYTDSQTNNLKANNKQIGIDHLTDNYATYYCE